MITFQGIDAAGNVRQGILHTRLNVGNWITYQHQCNWRSLRVACDGKLIGGITHQRGSSRSATVWMSVATAMIMKGVRR